MQIRVGLKTGDLIHLFHRTVHLSCGGQISLSSASGQSHMAVQIPQGQMISITASDDDVTAATTGRPPMKFGKSMLVNATSQSAIFSLSSETTPDSGAKRPLSYRGTLEFTAHNSALRVVLITDLETYVQGVLQSEVPGYFNLEAMKAQAVLARTYGLHPRLSHEADGFNVCDSYLHCQAFYGVRQLNSLQKQAIDSTKHQLLMYQQKPALALFSACAGGHTEDYQFCFSDPQTNAFPPPPIPYLTGVAEGKLPEGFPSEAAMRKLFKEPHPPTDDSWSSSSFRWTVVLSADALEGHMHYVVKNLQTDPQFAPFIEPPKSGQFGHITGFEAISRGVAGTIVALSVDTTAGTWLIRKELTIRSLFENPDVHLKRLKSARIFFDISKDANGLISSVAVHGFGSGHGVGLQQVGAQGLAQRGLKYTQILDHYYHGTELGTL